MLSANVLRQSLIILHFPPTDKVDIYDFIPTEVERLCQSGAGLDGLSTKAAIPNTVHYVVGLHDAELSFAAYPTVLTALRSLELTTVNCITPSLYTLITNTSSHSSRTSVSN
jgi:hypothetical protein